MEGKNLLSGTGCGTQGIRTALNQVFEDLRGTYLACSSETGSLLGNDPLVSRLVSTRSI
jgi:hypothetical protein